MLSSSVARASFTCEVIYILLIHVRIRIRFKPLDGKPRRMTCVPRSLRVVYAWQLYLTNFDAISTYFYEVV